MGLAYIYQVNLHVFRGSHACRYQVAVELYRVMQLIPISLSIFYYSSLFILYSIEGGPNPLQMPNCNFVYKYLLTSY